MQQLNSTQFKARKLSKSNNNNTLDTIRQWLNPDLERHPLPGLTPRINPRHLASSPTWIAFSTHGLPPGTLGEGEQTVWYHFRRPSSTSTSTYNQLRDLPKDNRPTLNRSLIITTEHRLPPNNTEEDHHTATHRTPEAHNEPQWKVPEATATRPEDKTTPDRGWIDKRGWIG